MLYVLKKKSFLTALMPSGGNLSELFKICQDISAVITSFCFSAASIRIGGINRVNFQLFARIGEGEMT
jgi:hypothetical protein